MRQEPCVPSGTAPCVLSGTSYRGVRVRPRTGWTCDVAIGPILTDYLTCFKPFWVMFRELSRAMFTSNQSLWTLHEQSRSKYVFVLVDEVVVVGVK